MSDSADQFEVQLDGFPTGGAAPRTDCRSTLEVVLSELVERHRRGEDPDLREYVRRYPHLATELEESLLALAAIEHWKVRRESEILRSRIAGDSLPERIGSCRIVRRIGSGGMGVVYEAQHDTIPGLVAVKQLPSRFSRDSAFRRRFEQEARTVRRLRHPHIVPVLEFGEDDGFCYYVMPSVPGVSLRWLLERLASQDGAVYAEEIALARGGNPADSPSARPPATETGEGGPTPRRLERNSWWQLARIALQVAGALQYAHRRNVIHRDIKPENLLLDAAGRVWITDFGVAGPPVDAETASQLSSGPDARLRNADGLVGTLKYMAPERFRGECDGRSDIFSLGMTLYELVTLQYPFDCSSRTELASALCTRSPAPIRDLVPDCPPELAAIVEMMLARDVNFRYVSTAALISDLRRFLKHRPLEHAVVRQPVRRNSGWFRRLLERWSGNPSPFPFRRTGQPA